MKKLIFKLTFPNILCLPLRGGRRANASKKGRKMI